MVAAGELDVAILMFGGLWDFAATSLIVREAGGVFRDAWGGTAPRHRDGRVHERRARRSGPGRRWPSSVRMSPTSRGSPRP